MAIALAPAAHAQAPPPCAPGAAAAPVFGAAGYPEAESGDMRLFATHPVTVAAGFPSSGPPTNFDSAFSFPPPFARVSEELSTNGALPRDFDGETEAAVVLGEQAGPLPATVAWTQSDGTANGACSAYASQSFTLIAAVPPRLRRPRSTPGAVDESRTRLNLIRASADLRPLEVRYRVVRARHFPGSHVKARIVTFPLRSSDPGFKRVRTVSVKKAGLRLTIDPELAEQVTTALTFTIAVRVSPRGSPFGYELALFQGAKRESRLRVSGRCKRVGGFITCSHRRARVD